MIELVKSNSIKHTILIDIDLLTSNVLIIKGRYYDLSWFIDNKP